MGGFKFASQRAQKIAARKKLQRKTGKQLGKLVITIIIYIYIYIYTHQLTCADYYTRLLQILSTHANHYTRFLRTFLNVKKSKTYNTVKKRHGKKPLQFCNMKKLVKTSTYKIWAVPFFKNSFWALHSSNKFTIQLQ